MRSARWRGTRLLGVAVLVVVGLAALTGHAEPAPGGDPASAGSGATLLVLAALAALLVLGSPVFVALAVLGALCWWAWGAPAPLGPCPTVHPDAACGLDVFPAEMADLATRDTVLAIPQFVLAGGIATAGETAERLVAATRSLLGWLPGGAAVSAVAGCLLFAAVGGGSAVAIVAVGSMVIPALGRASHDEPSSVGVVTTAGVLGVLVPPSIAMLVLAAVYRGAPAIEVGELFVAGIGPGLLVAVLLSTLAVLRSGVAAPTRDAAALVGVVLAWGGAVWVVNAVGPPWLVPTLHVAGVLGLCAVRRPEALFALLLPVGVVAAIGAGVLAPAEAGAVAVAYVLVIEAFVHRRLAVDHLPRILADAALTVGPLFLVMAVAFGLDDFLVAQGVLDRLVDALQGSGPIPLLLLLEVVGLVVGLLLEPLVGLAVLVPLAVPAGVRLGVDPLQLAVALIASLAIGRLVAPDATELRVADSTSEKSRREVLRSVAPFVAMMLVALGVIACVPSLTLGPVELFLRGAPADPSSEHRSGPEVGGTAAEDPLRSGR